MTSGGAVVRGGGAVPPEIGELRQALTGVRVLYLLGEISRWEADKYAGRIQAEIDLAQLRTEYPAYRIQWVRVADRTRLVASTAGYQVDAASAAELRAILGPGWTGRRFGGGRPEGTGWQAGC